MLDRIKHIIIDMTIKQNKTLYVLRINNIMIPLYILHKDEKKNHNTN